MGIRKSMCLFAAVCVFAVSGGTGAHRPVSGTTGTAAWFDFMVGTWTYEFPNGSGTHETSRRHGDVVLQSEVAGAFGETLFSGTSIMSFDSESGAWNKVWIDSLSNFLVMDVSKNPDGALTESWEMPNTDGSVVMRQSYHEVTERSFVTVLEVSSDGGESYRIARRNVYTRVDSNEG